MISSSLSQYDIISLCCRAQMKTDWILCCFCVSLPASSTRSCAAWRGTVKNRFALQCIFWNHKRCVEELRSARVAVVAVMRYSHARWNQAVRYFGVISLSQELSSAKKQKTIRQQLVLSNWSSFLLLWCCQRGVHSIVSCSTEVIRSVVVWFWTELH